MGVDATATAEAVRATYYRRARGMHPDAGGDHQQMAALNRAFDAFKAAQGQQV